MSSPKYLQQLLSLRAQIDDYKLCVARALNDHHYLGFLNDASQDSGDDDPEIELALNVL